MHPRAVAAAIAELRAIYPKLAVGGLDGGNDEESSYLHLIVCFVEYQKMKALIGSEPARRVMEFWAADHYRAIYRVVLDDEENIGKVVRRDDLLPSM